MNTSQKMRNVGKNNFMRKLALSDEILLSVQQPARYIGGEFNMAEKVPNEQMIRFAMCFPDVYEIGMSHLACRSFTPCSTSGKMYIVNVSFLPGRI